MDLYFLTNMVILGFGAICIHYVIRIKEGAGYFFVNILTAIPLVLITIRDIQLAIPMLTMIVVWEIKSIRKDSE
ncbi:hypothetical protein CD110_03910 [Staphylococcus casei]|nr:hypothetical protein CD110_03910 [Staphylococcus casei]